MSHAKYLLQKKIQSEFGWDKMRRILSDSISKEDKHEQKEESQSTVERVGASTSHHFYKLRDIKHSG